jgi:DNA (cytosine-5)-methyltransferase 1
MYTLNTVEQHSVCYGISAYESNAMKSGNPNSGCYVADTSRTLDNNGGNPACNQGGIAVVYENHAQDCRYGDVGDTAPTVTSRYGTGGATHQ